MNCRQADGGQSLRNLTQQFDPARVERQRERKRNSGDYHEERHRFVLEKYFSENEHGERAASQEQRSDIRFVHVSKKIGAVLPKIPVCPVKAAELRQLSAGEKERHAAFPTQHDTLSEIKFTIAPARQSHATNAISAENNASSAASPLNRLVSPLANWPSDAPIKSEMADVTVIAVRCELQKIQNTRPAEQARVKPGFGRKIGE